MTGWIFAAITCFLYILQTTILCKLTVFGIMPDAVLVCVLCYSIIFGREKGFVAAFFVGLIMDFLTGAFFGRHIIIYVLSSALASFLADNTFGKNFVTAAIITLIVSLAGGIAMSVFLYIAKIDRNILGSLIITTPIYSLYNMVAGVFIFIVIENLKKFAYGRE
ncbi:MAG: rod shape-determining protein MreD [Monoglobales bacterium]